MSTVANPRRTGAAAAPQPAAPEPTAPAVSGLRMIAPTGVVCDGDTCAIPGTSPDATTTDAVDAGPRP